MGTSVTRGEGTLSLLNEKSVIYNLGEKNVKKDFTTFRACNVVVYITVFVAVCKRLVSPA